MKKIKQGYGNFSCVYKSNIGKDFQGKHAKHKGSRDASLAWSSGDAGRFPQKTKFCLSSLTTVRDFARQRTSITKEAQPQAKLEVTAARTVLHQLQFMISLTRLAFRVVSCSIWQNKSVFFHYFPSFWRLQFSSIKNEKVSRKVFHFPMWKTWFNVKNVLYWETSIPHSTFSPDVENFLFSYFSQECTERYFTDCELSWDRI